MIDLEKGDEIWFARCLPKLSISYSMLLKVRTIFDDGSVVAFNKDIAVYLSKKDIEERVRTSKKDCDKCLKHIEIEYKKLHKNEVFFDYNNCE